MLNFSCDILAVLFNFFCLAKPYCTISPDQALISRNKKRQLFKLYCNLCKTFWLKYALELSLSMVSTNLNTNISQNFRSQYFMYWEIRVRKTREREERIFYTWIISKPLVLISFPCMIYKMKRYKYRYFMLKKVYSI